MTMTRKAILTCLWMVYSLSLSLLLFPSDRALAGSSLTHPSPSFWAGAYIPKDETLRSIYPDYERGAGFLELSWGWPWVFETSLGLGGSYFRGETFSADGSTNTDKALLSLGLGYLQLCAPFRYSQEQWVVPYLGGGLDLWGFREKTEKDPIEGYIYGYHYLAGLRILLDWLEPKAAYRLYQDQGIKNTYLVLEARTCTIDDFSTRKLNLSGTVYKLGLLCEF